MIGRPAGFGKAPNIDVEGRDKRPFDTNVSYAEYLKTLTKNEKAFLARHICAWCDQKLNRTNCSAIYDTCTDEDKIKRADACLATYKPRQRSS